MCGGAGTRLGTHREKPLVPVDGVAMVDRVIDALANSAVEDTYAVASPAAPTTAAHVHVPCIESPGEGYVDDLQSVLADPRVEEPVLTVAGDLPLLDGTVVDAVLDRWDGGSLTVAVPVARKRALGASVDAAFTHERKTVAPAGLNVVGGDPELVLVREDDRLAVNVNRPRDLAVARALA